MKNYKYAVKILSLTIGMCIIVTTYSCKEEVEEPIVDLVFHGKYAGGWSSTATNGSVYNGIAASAIINEGINDIYSGEFFFTRNHRPCCGGDGNNGTIYFTMKDSVITDFQYSDTVPGCPGSFSGDGALTKEGKISIDFTGSDCEGKHSGGRLVLSKSN